MTELVVWVCANVRKMGFHSSTRTSHIRQNLIPNGPVALRCLTVVDFPQHSSQRKGVFFYVCMKQAAHSVCWWVVLFDTFCAVWEIVAPALMLFNTSSPKFIYRSLFALRINIASRLTDLTNSILKCSPKIYSPASQYFMFSDRQITQFQIGYHKSLHSLSK